MSIPLAVLIIEDMESDAQILVRLLKKADYELVYEQIETAEQMCLALKKRTWDVVLSDYNLPQFNGRAALKLLQETGSDIPFIIVSGAMGEETAVAMMKAGAHDYLIKGNLARLVPVVERELEQAKIRRGHKQADEALRENARTLAEAQRIAHIGSYEHDLEGDHLHWSDEVFRIFGIPPDQFDGTAAAFLKGIHPDDLTRVQQTIIDTRASGRSAEFEYRIVRPDGSERIVQERFEGISEVISNEGKHGRYIGTVHDITERKQAEEALQESEARYKNLFENNHAVMLIIDPDSAAIMDANPAACAYYGWSREEFLKKKIDEINTLATEEVSAEMQLARAETRNYFFFKHRQADGTVRDVEVYSGPLELMGKTLLYSIVHDITERKQAEEEIRRQTQQIVLLYEASQRLNRTLDLNEIYQTIFEFLSAVASNDRLFISSFDPETERITYRAYWIAQRRQNVSPFPSIRLEAVGESPQSIVIRTGQSLLINDYQAQGQSAQTSYDINDEINEIVKEVSTEPGIPRSALIIPLKIGDKVTGVIQVMSYRLNAYTENQLKLLEALALHIVSAEQNALLYSQVQAELYERKQTEKALYESEVKYRSLVETAQELVWKCDINWRFTYLNPAWEKTHGYQVEEMLGKGFGEFQRPEVFERDTKEFSRHLAGGSVKEYETTQITKDGQELTLLFNAIPFFDAEGNIVGTQGTAIDITQRKRTEEALRLRSAALEAAANTIVITHRDGTIEWANLAFTTLTGYALSEAIGKNPRDLIRSGRHDQEFYKNLWGTVMSGRVWHGEIINRRKDNNLYTEEMTITPLHNESGEIEHFIAIKQDITERKQAEEALRASEGEYRQLINFLPSGVVVHHAGRIILANSASAKIFGAESSEELIGTPLIERVHPDYHDIVRNRVQQSLYEENMAPLIEEKLLRVDGTAFDAEVAAMPVPYAGKPSVLAVFNDITERKKNEEEIRRYAHEFSALYETSMTLTLQNDLSNLLQVVAEYAITLINAPSGGIYLYDAVHNDLELVITLGVQTTLVTRMPLGQGLTGRVAQSRQSIFVDNYRLWEGRLPTDEGYPFTAMLGVPMLYGGELIGVLLAREVSENGRKFTEADSRLLSLFAAQAAGAIHDAKSNEEIAHRVSELEAVSTISTALRSAQTLEEMLPRFLSETLLILGAESGALWLYDDVLDILQCTVAQGWMNRLGKAALKRGAGIVGNTFVNGKPYLSKEFATDSLTFEEFRLHFPKGWGGICLPVRTSAEIVGVLFVSVELPRQITSIEVQLLSTLAEIAGNTIHRMSLYEQTQQRLKRLSALRSIDVAISSSFDLAITLGIIFDQIESELGAEAVNVFLYHPSSHILTYAARRGFLQEAATVRLGEGLASKVIVERKTISKLDLQNSRLTPKAEGFVAYHGMPLVANGELKGVLEVFHRKQFKFNDEWLDFFETLGGQTAIAIDHSSLFESLQKSNLDLQLAYDATIEGWSRALDLRDKETEGHSQRVTELAESLARAMGISEAEIVHLRRGSLLHDIGKMGVPDDILLKPDKLTDEEWLIMKKHPQYAYEMLSPIDYLRPALNIPYSHHEKWDGTGYPRGLKGEEIPLVARIFAVADVWDALISDRPYRTGWSTEYVYDYIREQSGKYFDPQVVEVFLKIQDFRSR